MTDLLFDVRKAPAADDSAGDDPLEKLLRDPSVAERIDSLSPQDVPALLTTLGGMALLAAARLTSDQHKTRPAKPEPDQLLTVDQVAERLKVSKHCVYRKAKRLPFTRRVGRALRFSSAGLTQWMKSQGCHSAG